MNHFVLRASGEALEHAMRFIKLVLACVALAQIPGATVRAEPLAARPQGRSGGEKESHATRARIARIEKGLLHRIIVRGRPIPTMRLEERMAHYKVPGVSIAFFANGRIEWAKAYGVRDRKKQPVTVNTLFQAASISKPVAALGALRLVREQKLSLDEDVNKKFIGWTVPANPLTTTEKVTLRRLLSHSAGLNVHGFDGYAPGEPRPEIEQILRGEPPANNPVIQVDTRPGERWKYSGGGYVMLQKLMEDATGEAFPSLLHRLVLAPAGMTLSGFYQPLPASLEVDAARAHDARGHMITGGSHIYPELAAAGLWTTPSDLAHLALEVIAELENKSDRILDGEGMRRMLTPEAGKWGLGFKVSGPPGKPRFEHSGSNEGFRCDVMAFAEKGEGVVVMTNGDGGGYLLREIELAVATEYGWDMKPEVRSALTLNHAQLRGYAGTYKLPDGSSLVIRMKAGRLEAIAPETPDPMQIIVETQDRLFTLPGGERVDVLRAPDGAIAGLRMADGSEATRLSQMHAR